MPQPGHTMLCAGTLLLLMGIASAQGPDRKDSRFPDGPGRAVFLTTCGECHGADNAVAQLKTRDEWRKTLDEMAANGAQATDDDWALILDYVDRHFSLILVNAADVQRLSRTLDVAQAQAEAIVRYRDEHGRFTGLDDLKKVPGVAPATIDSRKDRFVF